MKLSIWGNHEGGYSASGEYEPSVDPILNACPFCGGMFLVVVNTHTPSYWVECNSCGAEKHVINRPLTGRIRSKDRCAQMHRAAFGEAIKQWNQRRPAG